jgi:hypothetical protein
MFWGTVVMLVDFDISQSCQHTYRFPGFLHLVFCLLRTDVPDAVADSITRLVVRRVRIFIEYIGRVGVSGQEDLPARVIKAWGISHV